MTSAHTTTAEPDAATARAMAEFDARVARLGTVGLDDVQGVSVAARHDRKHLVRATALEGFVAALGDRFAALEVGGRRAIGYHTSYFDTPDLQTFDDHRRGRRRRFKIRTRHYGDPAATMLEVKCRGTRGQTVKYRGAHPGPDPRTLDASARRFVHDTLRSHYGFGAPADLRFSLDTRYVRTTLVDLDAGERVTIDRFLHVADDDTVGRFDPGWVIVETKTASVHAASRRALSLPGARAGRMSKYCLGVAELHRGVVSNPWRRAHRRLSTTVRWSC